MNLIRKFVVALLLLCVAAVVIYRLKDPERRTLNEEARREAPGHLVALPDGATYYQAGGPDTGRVVVLAAGFSVPSYIWDSLYYRLADSGFRVIRYDYFGRGWSDRPATTYDQGLFVRQLDGLMDSLHITQPFDLAGLSFGGTIVTSYTAAHPDRVRTLMYFDPVFNNARQPTRDEGNPLRWDFKMVMQGGTDAMATSQLEDFYHPERHPDWPDRYRVQQQFKGFREALRRTRVALRTDPVQDTMLVRLGQDPRPVLIVWGRHDTAAPFAGNVALRQAMTNAMFVPVDSAGHLPHLEQPELVSSAVIGFLRSH